MMMSMSHVVDDNRIRTKRELHRDHESELDFVASHFSEAGLGVPRCLSVSDLELVLTNPDPKLESGNQLDEAILWLSARKP